jgi:hypothetical protein
MMVCLFCSRSLFIGGGSVFVGGSNLFISSSIRVAQEFGGLMILVAIGLWTMGIVVGWQSISSYFRLYCSRYATDPIVNE